MFLCSIQFHDACTAFLLPSAMYESIFMPTQYILRTTALANTHNLFTDLWVNNIAIQKFGHHLFNICSFHMRSILSIRQISGNKPEPIGLDNSSKQTKHMVNTWEYNVDYVSIDCEYVGTCLYVLFLFSCNHLHGMQTAFLCFAMLWN